MKPDQLIIIESLKMNLLSKSCITPGIMALVTNLVMTAGDMDVSNEEDWMKEYCDGRGHEIYRIQLKEYYYQFTFMEVVENIYNQGQVIAFALEIEVGGVSIIKLNPSNCNDMTILNLIEKAKDFSFKKKQDKESYDNFVDISDGEDLGNTLNLNSKSKEKDKSYRTFKGLKGETYNQNNVKVFTYLICSDKSEADTVANKEQNLIKLPSMENSISTVNNNDNNINDNKNESKEEDKEENNTNNLKDKQIEKKISIYNVKKSLKRKDSMKDTNINSFHNFLRKNSLKNLNYNKQENLGGGKIIFKEFMKNMNENINKQIALIEDDSSSESEEDIDNENMIHFGSVALEVSSKDFI